MRIDKFMSKPISRAFGYFRNSVAHSNMKMVLPKPERPQMSMWPRSIR
ncbi:hypothetical protein R77564_05064 [Ralstonia sp. LMG 32965]|uniref:Uncharacterized protein n=1 Tax=Ralstonia flatus TaxID=3058601 RepID=A0ABM9L5N7_9RALS|nr:hypothetical protein R77564_05064 [Ralstonia sp. LMG 32965]